MGGSPAAGSGAGATGADAGGSFGGGVTLPVNCGSAGGCVVSFLERGMGRPSDKYRSRYQTIARYVSFGLPKRLTKKHKAKITRYYNRIGKALAKGYQAVKAKDDGRIKKAHRAQGIRGLTQMRVVLVKPTGNGFKVSIGKNGTIRSSNPKSGISKVTIPAQFFDAEEADEVEVKGEAAWLIKQAKEALGHKPQRCAVAYWGGENAWAEISFLPDLLVVSMNQYSNGRGYPADGISFYWIKRSKRVLEVQSQLREERKAASERRAEQRRRSDV